MSNALRVIDSDGNVQVNGLIETGSRRSARRVTHIVAELAAVPGNRVEVLTRRGWERRYVVEVRRGQFYTRVNPNDSSTS